MNNDPFAEACLAGLQLVASLGTEPQIAVVLGSGWQAASNAMGDVQREIEMADLAGFAKPTADGHGHTVRRIDLQRTDGSVITVAVFQGRAHLYEGHSATTVVHGVRTAIAAGCTRVVLTNAAGSLDPALSVGSVVVVSDHLNLTSLSPLTGDVPPAPLAGRFVDLTDLYSPRLRRLVLDTDTTAAEGVYAGLAGPHFETPAEIRAYRTLGADVLGFSTVLEAIAAHHQGAEVVGLSLVTNLCAGLQPRVRSEDVITQGQASAARIGSLLRDLIASGL